MFPCAGLGYGFWWIFPIIMIVLMVLCFFMMRGRMGPMMCRPGFRGTGSHGEDASDPALDVLDRRYAQGEINKEEYKEKKRAITRHN
jgi:putative membrane protein